MEIKQYKYERVETSSKIWNVPIEPQYFFETHIRRSIMIKPIFSTWQKEQGKEEEIYQLEIVCVYLSFKCKIELHKISVSDIEDLYDKDKTKEADLIRALIDGQLDIRTKRQFISDYNTAITTLNDSVNNTTN